MVIVINSAETFYNIYNKDFSRILSFQPVSSLHLLSAFQNFGYEWYDKIDYTYDKNEIKLNPLGKCY